LEITEDISSADIEAAPYTRTSRIRFAPDPEYVDQALALLRESSRPLVYAGRGALYAKASEELRTFIEAYSLPVMTTLPGKGAISEDHPFCLGLGGYPRAAYSTGPAKKYAEEADLILALGCSFRQHATSRWLPKPANTRLIQVDVDPAELHKNYRADLAILSDIKLFLQAMLRKAPEVIGGWRQGTGEEIAGEIQGVKTKWLDSWKERLTTDEIPMNPYRVCWDLGHILDRRNTILLHDAGTARVYIAHHYETLFPLGFIGFGGTSSMGWSTPAAMGAKLAHPDKVVVNVTGDGSFGMTGMEIETAARHGIRTLTIILNNQSLNATRQTQHGRFEGREIGIALGGDYARLAQALGGYGERVAKPEDLKSAVTRAINHPGPAVLDVMVKPLEPRP
jgi:acetolactate synthase-1/2/3 large subunit